MRFVISGEWTRNSMLRLIMLFFFCYVLFFISTNFFLYFRKMDLTAQSVVDYYLGNPDTFSRPKSVGGMMEVSHYHLFAFGMLILTLAHLLLFIEIKTWKKLLLICTAFISGLMFEGAGWLVRFVSPSFAFMKVAGFVLLEVSLLAISFIVLYGLIFKMPSDYRRHNSK